MVLGAYRSGARVQWALAALYVAAVMLILVAPPSAASLVPSFAKAGEDYFANVAPALGRLLGIPDLRLDTRLTSLLAFVYTYHYLNWFIKADVIHWNQMTRERLVLVAAASAASTALYFYDYALGFTVLLAFSLAHARSARRSIAGCSGAPAPIDRDGTYRSGRRQPACLSRPAC